MLDSIRLQAFVLPSLEVQTLWASHHRWLPGQVLLHNPAQAHALWLMLRGVVDVGAAGERWRVAAPQVFLSPRQIPRDISTPQGAEWYSVGLQLRLFGRIDVWQGLRSSILWGVPDADRDLLQAWMGQLIQERRDGGAVATLICDGLARAIVGVCLRTMPSSALPSGGQWSLPPWLEAALRCARDEPGADVRTLAVASGYSPAQFRLRFHQWVGQSPQTYLRSRRLAVARHMLESDLPIGEIAQRLGFRSVSPFTRRFRQTFGVPPSAYRKQAVQAKM